MRYYGHSTATTNELLLLIFCTHIENMLCYGMNLWNSDQFNSFVVFKKMKKNTKKKLSKKENSVKKLLKKKH